MSDTKLIHLQDDTFFLVKVANQHDYDNAAAIRERIRDREQEVDKVYAPIQTREKKQAAQIKADRKKTALERESWLVVHDGEGGRHQLSTIDKHLKTQMSNWSTEQHQRELETTRRVRDMQLAAQESVKIKMLTEAAGDPEIVKGIHAIPFLSSPPATINVQLGTTRVIEVTVLDISKIAPEYLEADLPKIKALAKSRGIEHALNIVGGQGVAIKETLSPRRKPRRKQ